MMSCFYINSIYKVFGLLLLLSNVSGDHDKPQAKTRVYIVYMGASTAANGEHARLLNELVERKNNNPDLIHHVYNKSFLGFAARLSEAEAKSIARRPGVVSVFPNSDSRPHITHSWDFLMKNSMSKNTIDPASISSRSNDCNGSSDRRDTIIGFIDSGIWPHHPIFNDKFMGGSIPKHWKGICMTGNDSSVPFNCTRKLIGARYYVDLDYPGSISSPMDESGHGTHVASIAVGTPVHGASYYGLADGIAKGGSPFSRFAVYRVCGSHRCPASSMLKAFDDAIADGVDVISVSFSSEIESLLSNPIAIGSFHAAEKGVIVVAPAGNGGPSSGTVRNLSPWILTVAATTIDRDFQVDIALGCANDVIKGGGINFSILNKSAVYDLTDGRSAGHNQKDLTNAENCVPGSLDDAKVKGKIVLCGNTDPIPENKKIDAMIEQGVIGIIMMDDTLRQMTYIIKTTIPFAAVSQEDGARIQSYINAVRTPLTTILPTQVVLNHKPAPVVAGFSGRGPAPGLKNLIKPDVAAPGVAILGACTVNDPSAAYPGKEPSLFSIRSGTSSASPHVSALAAIVTFWHSNWPPSAIKSAIMTTAISKNNENDPITSFTGSRATPHDIGSGEINVFGPLWPGLVYETETVDYMMFLCNFGYTTSEIKLVSKTVPDNFSCPRNSRPDLISDMNYPSIAVSGLTKSINKTVRRTVTNVGSVYSGYTSTVEAPDGVDVQVVPNKLQFTTSVKKLSFQVTFSLTASAAQTKDLFGSITWSDNINKVRSPFVVSNA